MNSDDPLHFQLTTGVDEKPTFEDVCDTRDTYDCHGELHFASVHDGQASDAMSPNQHEPFHKIHANGSATLKSTKPLCTHEECHEQDPTSMRTGFQQIIRPIEHHFYMKFSMQYCLRKDQIML